MPADRPALRGRAFSLASRAVPALGRIEDERRELRARVASAERDRQRTQQELDTLRGDLILAEAAGAGSTVDELQYLFVITYGRSGSTLLMGILDSTPGFLIRGENRDALYRLYQYQSALVRARKQWSKDGPLATTDAWFGIDDYDAAGALAGLRNLVIRTLLRPQPDTRVTGFKEIRWWHDDWRAYLDFLCRLFPGARFVMNVRDHAAVSQSKWWARNPDAFARLQRYEAQLDAMAEHLGDRVYRVNFDEFVADPGVLEGLFDWLGEPFDRARVEATMAIKHSS